MAPGPSAAAAAARRRAGGARRRGPGSGAPARRQSRKRRPPAAPLSQAKDMGCGARGAGACLRCMRHAGKRAPRETAWGMRPAGDKRGSRTSLGWPAGWRQGVRGRLLPLRRLPPLPPRTLPTTSAPLLLHLPFVLHLLALRSHFGSRLRAGRPPPRVTLAAASP